MLDRFPKPDGSDLVALRKRLGVTQKDIADVIRKAPKTLWEWETGRTPLTIPNRDAYEAAAVAIHEQRKAAAE